MRSSGSSSSSRRRRKHALVWVGGGLSSARRRHGDVEHSQFKVQGRRYVGRRLDGWLEHNDDDERYAFKARFAAAKAAHQHDLRCSAAPKGRTFFPKASGPGEEAYKKFQADDKWNNYKPPEYKGKKVRCVRSHAPLFDAVLPEHCAPNFQWSVAGQK